LVGKNFVPVVPATGAVAYEKGAAPEAMAPEAVAPDARPTGLAVALHPDVHGKSGALLTLQSLPGEEVAVPLEWQSTPPAESWYRWVPASTAARKASAEGGSAATTALARQGTLRAPAEPGLYHLMVGAGEQNLILDGVTLIVRVPFARKQGTHLQGYFIGRFPTEGKGRTDRYAPPAGFIEVTRESQNLQLSEHFKIREFLTKDQHNVWPKYVVIEPALLEKLELVMQELEAMGVPAKRMHVMSGFRTPQYNARGLTQGRANLSRHQFGDAADVWIDNDGDGYMDDLNKDGRRDTGDAQVMLKAVERVVARHPELTGGAGVYKATSAHGPFIHIDVRGTRARW
jgi:uncharacterized protein YcbK (DUF882 family)